ncbi:MAG: threonine synthase [Veillonellales bacterium]
MKFVCSVCGKTYGADELVISCSCGGYLKLAFPFQTLKKKDIVTSDHSLWRYEKALPFPKSEIFASLGEGMTPLVQAKLNGVSLLFKTDYVMPTGSFKDRGAVMVINYLKKHGAARIVNDSSGNAAASYAGYCAVAELACDIFVPADTSDGKLTQIEMYGARVTKVPGTRDDVTIAAKKAAEESKGTAIYANHSWHPLFLQGTKTLAYEIWEQMGWDVPDNVIVPFGGGSSLIGLYYGFSELLSAGEITNIPRLYAIQSQNCNPLYAIYIGKEDSAQCLPTLAEGLALAKPVKRYEACDIVRKTKGAVEVVSEEEIVTGLRLAAKVGFYVEPTTAVAIAGTIRLLQNKVIQADEKTVVLLTGSGLKATDKIASVMKS